MSFRGQAFIRLNWRWEEGAKDADKLEYTKTLTEGTGVDQAEGMYQVESVTLLDGNSTTYDLTALVRTILGDSHTTTFVTIKAIMIVNESEAGNLVVGAAGANEWSECFGADGDTVPVKPDSPWLWGSFRCGAEVDGTNKNLKVAASGDDVTYSMVIFGLLTPATGECSSA